MKSTFVVTVAVAVLAIATPRAWSHGDETFGFLLQWPTLLTLAMFPVLVAMYARLAVSEENAMRRHFGEEYEGYAARTPRFIPAFNERGAGARRLHRS